MVQARIFRHVRDTTAISPVFHGFLQWTPAHRAMHYDME
jgi:hypothetical protein